MPKHAQKPPLTIYCAANNVITLYGIPNCDTVKKARTWLNDHQFEFSFYDFKKMGVSTELLQTWLTHLPLEQLINRKGTTWKKLSSAEQMQATTASTAIPLLQAYPSLIKRPVLVSNAHSTILVGFDIEKYQMLRSLA